MTIIYDDNDTSHQNYDTIVIPQEPTNSYLRRLAARHSPGSTTTHAETPAVGREVLGQKKKKKKENWELRINSRKTSSKQQEMFEIDS